MIYRNGASRIVHTLRSIRNRIGCDFSLGRRGVGSCALLAMERFTELSEVQPLVVDTTIIFDMIGPFVTGFHLRKAGEC